MPNIWRQFRELLPQDPLLIGDVDTHNSDGTSTVTLLDGAIVRVRGQSVAIGSRAFIQGGEIRGEAPALPVSTITV